MIRVSRDASVGDALEELRKRLPEEHAAKRLRLLEVLHSRIYKVCDAADEVSQVNESYWTLRAEPVPDDDAGASPVGAGAAAAGGAGGDLLVHVYHVARDKGEAYKAAMLAASAGDDGGGGGCGGDKGAAGGGAGLAAKLVKGGKKQQQQAEAKQQQQQQQQQQQDGEGGGEGKDPAAVVPVLPFGEPFLLRIGRSETLASVRERVRARLDVKPDAFAKWRFCFVPGGRGLPEYLSDSDVPAERFAAPGVGHALGAEAAYLGCEHDDKGAKRPSGHRAAYGFERPVKINS